MGSNNEILKQMEFKSAITLQGDVCRIINQLPIASIVQPPFPNYLRNFSVKARNSVTLKTPAEHNLVVKGLHNRPVEMLLNSNQ